MLFDCDGGSFGSQRSAYTSSSLLDIAVIFLFRLTTLINSLPTHGVHNLSRMSGSSIFVWQTTVVGLASMPDGILSGSLKSDASDASESSESIRTSAGSYFLLSSYPSWILSTSLEALTTCLLLMCASCRCYRQIRLFWLMRWVGWPRPWIAIAFGNMLTVLIVAMTLPGCANLRVKRFRSLLVWAMIFSFPISVIAVGLSWNVIPVSRSWPRKIKFKSHLGAKATFYSSILLPFASGIDTVPISSVRMTCSTTVTKLMLLALLLVNRLGLL